MRHDSDYQEEDLSRLNHYRNHPWYFFRNKVIYSHLRTWKRCAPISCHCLELACGSGIISSYLSSKGYNVFVSDLYQSASEYIPAGCKFFPFDLIHDEVDSDHRFCFDVVILGDVIEHLENPVAALQKAGLFLKSDGIIIVTVPALRQLWSAYDHRIGHKKRYDVKTLGMELHQAGYAIKTIQYFMFLPSLVLFFIRNWKMFNYAQDPLSEMKASENGAKKIATRLLLDFDYYLGKIGKLPFGSSIIAVVGRI